MIKILLLNLLSILILSCASSPTGRKQLLLASDREMNHMGDSAFSEMKRKLPRETNYRVTSYVRCVADAVAEFSKDTSSDSPWEVVVFKDDSANAFALPGRKIGVHTGLLKVATNQHQLATVLGHEVAHVEARHGNERVSRGILAQTGLSMAEVMVSGSENRNAIMAGLGLGTQFGVLMPFGRKQESEADEVGLYLMAKAGFDPRESVPLWQNMGRASAGRSPEFLSTHPSPDTRIADLQAKMGQAMNLYEKALNRPQCSRP